MVCLWGLGSTVSEILPACWLTRCFYWWPDQPGTCLRRRLSKNLAEQEALGRSKGGFSCKVHAICDAYGLPINFILTGGQVAECKQAIPLLENISSEAVLGDKAYDANEFRDWLKARGVKAVIPPKSNRKDKIYCDFWHYKERHAVECLFGKLKYYRRISSRYEKKAINYRGMLYLASVFLWLR